MELCVRKVDEAGARALVEVRLLTRDFYLQACQNICIIFILKSSGNDIVYRDYVDISIAVATPKGLVVPVLRSADVMDFAEVERVSGFVG